jgi:dihydrofolate reductase
VKEKEGRKEMKAILAADRNWAIGNKGKLLVSIPADMRFFRETTSGNVVIMGRKTLESMPMGRPLKNRTNIILTRNRDLTVPGARVAHDTDELSKILEDRRDKECFVIGGEQIYRLLLPWCDTVYVTKIDYAYEADTYFPDLDRDPQWELAEESAEQTYFELTYTFRTYRRIGRGDPGREGISCTKEELQKP